MGFKALSLSAQILTTLEAEGYTTPTPIQAQAIPLILAGKDVMGVAQTGTGKTAAFAVPIIHRLLDTPNKIIGAGEQPSEAHNVAKAARKIRCLVLTPTRELAQQIEESFKTYGRGTSLRHTVVYGGVSAHWQVKALFHGVDVLVATPGRLLDLMGQGYVDLRYVQVLVLDEADQMLDMGFIHPIRQIVAKTPAKRQSLMFSATMPTEIRKLADTILNNPETVQVTPIASTVTLIDQSIYHVDKGAKPSLLVKYIQDNGIGRALVFTRTKHGADKVTRYLEKSGIRAAALHGNKSQGQRKRAMEAFVSQKPPVLVATDIAARGLDIDNVTHVVNYDLPNIPESYVHRIGRTGRAGASGFAVSFCDAEEREYLRDIERLTKQKIKVVGGHVSAPAGTHDERGDRGGDGRRSEGGNTFRRDRHPADAPRPAGKPAVAHKVGGGATPRAGQAAAATHAPSSHKPAQGGGQHRPSHGPSHKPAHAAGGRPAHGPSHKPAGRPQAHPAAAGGGHSNAPRPAGGFKPATGGGGARKPWGVQRGPGGGAKPTHSQNRNRFSR